MKVAYFDLGFSAEQYGLQPTRYGGGAVVARYLKEDPAVDFYVFAPAEAFDNMAATERRDRCVVLPPMLCELLRNGQYSITDMLISNHFDLVLHPHTCATIRRGSYRGPIVHWSGFDGSAGHPGNDYVLLYDPSFRAQFGERAKYVTIGKPVPDTWSRSAWESKEKMVFTCSRHDTHMNTIELAKRCLAEGFKGVFAGPIHNGYPLMDHIDRITTTYLGEIDEPTKMDLHRRAALYGMTHDWEVPFNQSIIEAQGQGTPIYTYPKGPFLKSYLQHGRNGFDASVYSLNTAYAAADVDVSYASWCAAIPYGVGPMVASFKAAFTEIVDEWKTEGRYT